MFRKLRNVLVRITRSGVRGLMVALVLLGLAPAAQASLTQRVTVNDRIARIREAVRERAQNALPAPEKSADEVQLAQWGNWPNWGNWGNWSNWNNWYNWGNWGNWGNF